MISPDSVAPQLVIIADDLTGAADTAGAFASGKLSVALSLSGSPDVAVDVLSLSTDCRDAGPADVTYRVLDAIERSRACGAPDRWFHKIDSALRGHPGTELSIMMDALGFETAVCVPAIPSQGRAVREGTIEIDALPLHRTTLGMGKETSCIRTILAGNMNRPMSLVDLRTVRSGKGPLRNALASAGPGVIVVDAESDEDLDCLAAALVELPAFLPVGSAGLGSALGRAYALSSRTPAPRSFRSSTAPVLGVVGSAHQISAEQVEVASQRGAALVRPVQVQSRWDRAEVDRLRESVAGSLRAGKDTILTLAGSETSLLQGQILADQLAWVAAGPILEGRCGALILTGGDIAAAVCDQLDAEFLWIRGEVSPAIPWGAIGAGPMAGMPVVTKAGSFGEPAALVEAIALLRVALAS